MSINLTSYFAVFQELEKFKFVLDYKIKELKKQIDPREQEIQDMKDQVRPLTLFLQAAQNVSGCLFQCRLSTERSLARTIVSFDCERQQK